MHTWAYNICSMDESDIDPNNGCRTKHNIALTDPVVGEVICANCGTVISDPLQEKNPEWSTYLNNRLVKTSS
jgi:transcription initiation factor TFIIIB Brf1 subunit/transcription initiation factor TFIIB